MTSLLTVALLCSLVPAFSIPAFSAEIVVGMSAAFTGQSESLGIELYRGSMAFLEHVNRRGGVHGRKIVIKAYDDAYNPAPAIQNTIALIEKDQAFVLFGYVGTPTVTRVLPLMKGYSERFISLLFPFTGAQPHRQPPYRDQVFNLRASYREETTGIVDNFLALGRNRIGVFYQADAYGRSGWDGVRQALAKNGNRKIAAEATYRRGATEHDTLDEQVKLLKNADVDAVVSVGSYAACAAFIRASRDAGWRIPIANLSFSGGRVLAALLSQASRANGKDYTRDLVMSQVVPSYEDTSLKAVREYRELMEKYNPKPPSAAVGDYRPLRHGFVSFEGFLNAKLMVEILTRMGDKPDRSRLREAGESIRNFDLGIDAPVSFGPDQHQGSTKIYYTTIQAGAMLPLKSWQPWKK